jgi:hypothetical protein
MITKELYDEWYSDVFEGEECYKPDEKPDGEDFHSLYDRVYFADVLMRIANNDGFDSGRQNDEHRGHLEKSRRILDSVIAEFTSPGFAHGAEDQELVLKTYLLMGRNLLEFPQDGRLANDFFEFAYKIIDRNQDRPELGKYDAHVYFFRYLARIVSGEVLEVISHVHQTLNNQLIFEAEPFEISLSSMLLAEGVLKAAKLHKIDDELAEQLAESFVTQAYLYLEKSGKYSRAGINFKFYDLEMESYRWRAGLYDSLFPWDEL